VPRGLWEDKPRDTGINLAREARFENANLSAPLWIEAYSDGGFLLLFFVFFIFARVHRRIGNSLASTAPPFGIIAVFEQLIILRGSLIATMASTTAIFAVWLCCTVRTRRSLTSVEETELAPAMTQSTIRPDAWSGAVRGG
jgi:hypothetical protein